MLKRWLLLSALLCVSVVQAADPLLISGGSDRAIPIAVMHCQKTWRKLSVMIYATPVLLSRWLNKI